MMNQPQQASPSPLPTALEVKQDYSISSMNNHNNRLDQSAHNMSHNQSMKSFSNLNQSQISALSSCSSNYNSRAESNSISHSVSSSNMSTSQQQRMIQNRVSGMQHNQPPFLAYPQPHPQQQQNAMNSKQS